MSIITAAPCFACKHDHDSTSAGPCWEAKCLPNCRECWFEQDDDAVVETYIHSIQMLGAADLRVEIPVNVGPLGARKSKVAAERLLASFGDCAGDDVIEGRVERMREVDGDRVVFVALFVYNRPVKR